MFSVEESEIQALTYEVESASRRSGAYLGSAYGVRPEWISSGALVVRVSLCVSLDV